VDVDTLLGWAHSMTWKGIHPIIKPMFHILEAAISLQLIDN
jgi:hypothetical protein